MLRGRELLVGDPLQPRVKLDRVAVSLLEFTHGLMRRVTQLGGPHRPAPVAIRILRPQVGVDRIVQRVAAQRFAALAAIVIEGSRARGPAAEMLAPEVLEQHLQHRQLGARDARVVDVLGGPQPRELALELRRRDSLARLDALGELRHVGHRDVQHVQEVPRRRAVRAEVPRIGRKQRVQRIQADERGPFGGAALHDVAQVGEVADAPVGA